MLLVAEVITELIDSLEIIASIGVGQKLRVIQTSSYGISVEIDNSWAQSVSRRYRGDSRESTLATIKKLVTAALEYRSLFLLVAKRIPGSAPIYSQRYDQLEKIVARVPNGLSNLKSTYLDDQQITGELAQIISDIESRISI